MGWHVLHGQVFSAMTDVDIPLVFDEIRVSSVVQSREFLDVSVAHVHAFHQRVSADDPGVK